MRSITAIMQRELISLFCSPIGYVVLFFFLLVTGVLVWIFDTFSPGKPASLRDLFQWMPLVLTIIVPAISMRTISEEYRTGTIESLMTAPVSEFTIVFGKYLASLLFFMTMLAGTFIYLILMAFYSRPDWGSAIASYVGLTLIGALFLAFSVFASSLTRNQIVAWIASAVPLLLVAWMGYFFVERTEGWLRTAFQEINVLGRFESMSRGILTSEALVFFLLGSALFVFLAVKVVESRRWR